VLAAGAGLRRAPDAAHLIALTQAAEPPRQELFRRLNRMPGGTAAMLRLRRALLRGCRAARAGRRRGRPAAPADALVQPRLPADEAGGLELAGAAAGKIIHHEAVHAIDGWDDLRRRLQPDRRCFAFFHPQLPDEPLIFVEVALLPEMPAPSRR
jgi:malonyl-CoA decarboxylase